MVSRRYPQGDVSVEHLKAELALVRRQLQEVLDRQAIRDCLATYCRGVDRMDRELILSVYHPDAVDDHCFIVDHPGPFADWLRDLQQNDMYSHQHIITTHTCALDGDVAHTETYWMSASVNKRGPELTLSGGRYLDRFEKRKGQWKIAARKLVYDWRGTPEGRPLSEAAERALQEYAQGARDKSDPSYQRPLFIPPERIGYVVPPF